MTMLFHIVADRDWSAGDGSYRGDSLDSEGFIHCSTAAQLTPVANRFYRGRSDLIVLIIDDAAVQAKIVYENLEGGNEVFPHIYGPLNRNAVVATFPLAPSEDGTFSPPADLARYRTPG